MYKEELTIGAVIPLSIKAIEPVIKNDSVTSGLYDCYYFNSVAPKPGTIDAEDPGFTVGYKIKEDLLFENYVSFLHEFYNCIGADFEEETHMNPEKIPQVYTMPQFRRVFQLGSYDNPEDRVCRQPFISYNEMKFSTLGCKADSYWVFYNSRSQLRGFDMPYFSLPIENLLVKTMTNPLAHAVKFGYLEKSLFFESFRPGCPELKY